MGVEIRLVDVKDLPEPDPAFVDALPFRQRESKATIAGWEEAERQHRFVIARFSRLWKAERSRWSFQRAWHRAAFIFGL